MPPLLTTATFVALFLCVLSLWWGRKAWPVVSVIAVALGYASGVLTGPAVVWLLLLAGFCLLFGYRSRLAKIAGAFGIIVLSLLLGLHALPGFHNLLVADDVVLSPGAAPYTLYLNFDKTFAGILILGVLHPALISSARDWTEALRRGLPILVLTVAVLIGGSLALGYVRLDPKWHELFWIWAASNLFLTCLTEEAFFRGFLQREMQNLLKGRSYADGVAIGVSAVAFGAAHLAGGPTYALLATVAGAGYGWVYARTGRIEMAMLTHFSLNAVHFLFFTYPRVAL